MELILTFILRYNNFFIEWFNKTNKQWVFRSNWYCNTTWLVRWFWQRKNKPSLPEFHLFGLSLLHHHCQVSRKHFNFDVRMRILVTITKGAKELYLTIFLGFTVTTPKGFCLVKWISNDSNVTACQLTIWSGIAMVPWIWQEITSIICKNTTISGFSDPYDNYCGF